MNEEFNALFTDEGFYRAEGKKAGKKANLYVTKEMLLVYKGSIAKEFTRQFGVVGGLLGGAIAEAKERDKILLHAVSLSDIVKISPKKSLLTGARIDFEQRDGENFNFAGTRRSMGGLKKSYQEILEIVKANNPNVVTD
jgi:hypothetical protein